MDARGARILDRYAGKRTFHACAQTRGEEVTGGNCLLEFTLWLDSGGRITAKREQAGPHVTELEYFYDAEGRLVRVLRNGLVSEKYTYNHLGQRLEDSAPERGRRILEHDSAGRLNRAGDTKYFYTREGTLRCRCNRKGSLYLAYGPTRQAGSSFPSPCFSLQEVIRPDRRKVAYHLGPSGLTLQKTMDGVLVESFVWRDFLRLGSYMAHDRGYALDFHYADNARLPDAARFTHPGQTETMLFFGQDQVGTLKRVRDGRGEKIKLIDYDSFGNVRDESWPWLFIPIGFAGGLRDRDTGFVRFGWRDYDPEVGRFTAQDPLGDTGGDHDPYEYCVDDPVNSIDPAGLEGNPFIQMSKKFFGLLGYRQTLKGVDKIANNATEAIKNGIDLDETFRTNDVDAVEKYRTETENNFGHARNATRKGLESYMPKFLLDLFNGEDDENN